MAGGMVGGMVERNAQKAGRVGRCRPSWMVGRCGRARMVGRDGWAAWSRGRVVCFFGLSCSPSVLHTVDGIN